VTPVKSALAWHGMHNASPSVTLKRKTSNTGPMEGKRVWAVAQGRKSALMHELAFVHDPEFAE